MRIEVDLLQCESNGMCVSVAPSWFSLDDDDTLHVVSTDVPAEDEAVVEAAVRMCPKQALRLLD